MNDNYVSQSIVNNEYDYSNSVPTIKAVASLVRYCDQMNKWLTQLVNEDEEKNKQYKPEYKEYMYKKTFSQDFNVYIREKTINNITCKDYESFVSAVKDGNLNRVNGLDIRLNLDFKRGKENNYEEHENSFTIIFNPYEITFARTSNYDDPSMNEIEDYINTILKGFPVSNSIFCTKQEE
jgi:hypothetical protein